MKCPLCNRELEITIEDDEGNLRFDDYENDPYSGLWYGILHPDYHNDCILSDTHYMEGYETREGAKQEIKRFKELVDMFRTGHEKEFNELLIKVVGMEKEDY